MTIPAGEAAGRLLVWGAGELGGRVAQGWAWRGAPVLGFTAGTSRHAALRAAGVEPRRGAPRADLRCGDLLLLALPGHAAQREALAALAGVSPPARALLVSSTGYYGTRSGRVDEATPAGTEPRARTIASLEAAFLDWAEGGGTVLRCGGLYRPGRGPYAALLRRGAPPPGPPDRTLPLLHYDDAAAAALAALLHPAPRPCYLGVLSPCPSRRAFYRRACRAAGLRAPRFEPPLDVPRAEFDDGWLRRDLLPTPRHPDWAAALA